MSFIALRIFSCLSSCCCWSLRNWRKRFLRAMGSLWGAGERGTVIGGLCGGLRGGGCYGGSLWGAGAWREGGSITCSVAALPTPWQPYLLCGSITYSVAALPALWQHYLLCGSITYSAAALPALCQHYLLRGRIICSVAALHTLWQPYLLCGSITYVSALPAPCPAASVAAFCAPALLSCVCSEKSML